MKVNILEINAPTSKYLYSNNNYIIREASLKANVNTHIVGCPAFFKSYALPPYYYTPFRIGRFTFESL